MSLGITNITTKRHKTRSQLGFVIEVETLEDHVKQFYNNLTM